MIRALLTFLAGGLAVLVYQFVRAGRGREMRAPVQGGLRGLLPPERSQESLLAGFRPDEMPDPTDALRVDQRILADALHDIARQRGAAAAVLWTLDETLGGIAMPVASSADDARSGVEPARMPLISATDRERIEWVARNAMPSIDQEAGRSQMAVAPLDASGQTGALSLHFEPGTIVGGEALRDAMPRHAKSMETLFGLVRTRADVARQNFRLRGLIRTAGTLQATRDPLELERQLVEDSLVVSGAEWAMLVRWNERERTGRIAAATRGAMTLGVDLEAAVVRSDSIVGETCEEGRPQVFVDARPYARGADRILGAATPLRDVGSFMAVPLQRSAQERPIGALVFGHREVAALRAMESRNARNLAIIAAGALETAWEVEDQRRNARTDALTGLVNRRGFDERYAQVIQETDRYGGTAGLILVDIDHFKQVNDRFGHDGGDAVLVAVATALADGRRTVDTTARLGGEELAILLPQTDAGGAREVAERMRKRLEALVVRTSAGEVRVTASFGVSEYAARGGDGARVVEFADQALYAAKRNGRNRVEVSTA